MSAPTPPRPDGAPDGAPDSGTGTARRPWQLAVVVLLVLLEAAALVGLGAAWLVDLVTGGAQSPGATAFLALFALGVGAFLALAARGLWQGRRWGRSPVMTWQVLLVVLGLGWLGTALSEGAGAVVAAVLVVLVVALVVAVGLLLPPVVAVTARGRVS